MTTQQIKDLQDELVRKGYLTQAEVDTGYGTYGPRTTAAVKRLQDNLVSQGYMTQAQVNTGYGTFGPQTTRAVQAAAQAPQKPQTPQTPQAPQGQRPPTQEEIAAEVSAHPTMAPLVQKYGTPEAAWAASGGDISQFQDQYGQPFSQEDQTKALSDSEAALDPYYKAEREKDTADTEALFAKDKSDFQSYLDTSGDNFQSDKAKLDQTAADQGVLFSGGRVQKQQNLQKSYLNDQNDKLNTLTSNVGNAARDYQYKYGNTNANAPALSQYYQAPTNNYNASVARGGVTPGGLSSVYNTGAYNFQGTEINKAKSEAQKRAAGLLFNKGNKLVAGGYKNQY